MGALSGLSLGIGADLLFSGLMIPFALDAMTYQTNASDSTMRGLLTGWNLGRAGIFAFTTAKWAAKGGLTGGLMGALVFFLKK